MSYTHHPISAHTDRITGISVCDKLHVFISSSLDATLRLWSEDNILLRLAPHNFPLCASVIYNYLRVALARFEKYWWVFRATSCFGCNPVYLAYYFVCFVFFIFKTVTYIVGASLVIKSFVLCLQDLVVQYDKWCNMFLCRVIHVGGVPSSVTFSSEKADLLIAMNETLYEISHATC